MSEILHIAQHTLEENIALLPFLFLTYLVMEGLEHKAGERIHVWVAKAGRFAPVIGAVAGAFPQCGFSTAASNLYAGRVITLGTLIAIFLSTSDEMLPIMISEQVSLPHILMILGIKILIGMTAGLVIDRWFGGSAVLKGHHDHQEIHEMCEREHCHCEKGIWYSVIAHTLHIMVFILLISFALNLVMHTIGEEALKNLILNRPLYGPVIAGVVGLIPNCASSVVITQLYLQQALDFGSMTAGLLVNAGVGLLVLFRVNSNRKENLRIVCLLYGIGVICGIFLQILGVLA